MRYFIFDKYNTWHDWRLTLTAKDVTPPEPKTNYVRVDGAHGSLDLTEALTGEVPYQDRTLTASFTTSEGSHADRLLLFRELCTALHGKKVDIVEPDDPDHYFRGRAVISGLEMDQVRMSFSVKATCEPWRYASEETVRTVELRNETIDAVLWNAGAKVLCPDIEVVGAVTLIFEGASATLSAGRYKVADLKLPHGGTVVRLVGRGTVTFSYREALL